MRSLYDQKRTIYRFIGLSLRRPKLDECWLRAVRDGESRDDLLLREGAIGVLA